MVSPVTVMGEAAPVALRAPQVAVYEVIGEPPLEAGGAKKTVACAFPAVAATDGGAPGTVAGVTLLEGADAGPVPTVLVAVTVKVYAVPLVKPVMTWLVPVVPALLSTPPAGFEITV